MLLQQFSDGIYYAGECKGCGFVFTSKLIDFDVVTKNGNVYQVGCLDIDKINKDATFDCPFCKSKIKEEQQ